MENEVAVKPKKTARKTAPEAVTSTWTKIERNIKYRVDEDAGILTIRINLNADAVESSTGRSMIVAQTNRFATLESADGLGLNLVLTKRKEKPAAKRKPRHDDDDE